MTDIIAVLTQAIDCQYRLKQQGRQWLIEDAVWARSPDRHSIGFSLDCDDSKPLAFFSNRPPAHLAKMCDALIAVLYRQKLYLFAIEAKSGYKANSSKQLVNGRHFWRWLIALCREHGYLNTETKYIALLVWQPRKRQIDKGTTAHRDDLDIKVDPKTGFTARVEVKNRTSFSLADLIQQVMEMR